MKSFELDDTLSPDVHSDRLVTLPIMKEIGQAVVERPRSTIEPRAEHLTGGLARVRDKLAVAGKGASRSLAGFALRETLGEGGMGIVRVAEQSALFREVAIKTLKADLEDSADAALRLLREAWLTGSLEHPNVVPIYDLGTDEEGRPHIVMRRVSGTAWDSLLLDPAKVREKHGASDVLDWHLRVLLQVTQAVSRAHAKGIVHRDIKPENVMVGEFGEVYLLDWGIAVSLVDDGSGRLPLAKDATEAAGTPCYMAPEMLGSPTPKIDERTDVYLLGAVLYEIVTGKPPHEGASFQAMVKSIVYSQPSFPDDCPHELAAVCTRAMARLHDDRFQTVVDLRKAVLDFLTHRGSADLAEEATAKRGDLFAMLGASTKVERQEIYNVFGAVRFGYLEALRTWPENAEARAGLRAVSIRMIDHELSQGSPEAAHAILAELTTPDPELAARVDAAMRAREEERRRIEKLDALEAEYDPNVGRRTRLFFGGVLGLLGVIGPISLALFQRGQPTMEWMLARTVGLSALCMGLMYWARDSMGKTRLNRNLAMAILVGYVMQVLAVPGCLVLGMSLELHLALVLLVWGILTTMLAITSEPKFVFPAVVYFVTFFLAAKVPSTRFWAQAVANGSNLAVVLAAWSTKEDLKRLQDGARELHRRAKSDR